MNELEWSLLEQRVRQPLKNWSKVVETVKQFSSPRHLNRWEDISLGILNNLYRELWRFPERVSLLRDNVVDLGDLGLEDDVLRVKNKLVTQGAEAKIRRLLRNPTVVTFESGVSYLALRKFGFRFRQTSRTTSHPIVYSDSQVTILLTTKVLYPARLLPILNGEGNRVEKLLKLNQILAGVALPRLVGTPEDNAELRVVNCRERLRRYEADLERVRNRGKIHERTRMVVVQATG